jgi:hypothetical protein
MTRNIIHATIVFLSCFIACTVRKPDDTIFSPKEFVNFKLIDNERFKYLHYKLDSIITVEYCEGTYTKQGNLYTIYPKDIGNRDFPCSSKQYQLTGLADKTRIKIKTDIVGDYLNQYQIVVKFDSKNIAFAGVNIDTTINERIRSHHLEVQVFIPDRLKNSYPIRSFTSISTSNNNLDTNSNFLDVQIPVSYQTFLYKNPGVIKIQDDGNFWLFVKDGKKIKKGNIML